MGVVLLGTRLISKSEKPIPTGDSLWLISISTTINNIKSKKYLHIAIPQDSSHSRVTGITLDHPDFALRRVSKRRKYQGEIVAIPINKGRITFHAEYKIQISHTNRWRSLYNRPVTLKPEEIEHYLDIHKDSLSDDLSIQEVLSSLRKDSLSRDTLLEKIYNFAHQQIVNDPSIIDKPIDETLKLHRGTSKSKASLMVFLCRANNIPARLVTGIKVMEKTKLNAHYWVEVYKNKQWIPYDPSVGFEGELPPNYLKLNIDSNHIAYMDDNTPVKISIKSVQYSKPNTTSTNDERRLLNILELERLPVSTQFLLASLFMLPFGALITTISRNIVGVLTYGTFTPSLLAMAIVYAEWQTVVVVVLIVIAVGFASRSVMPSHMTRIPRLSIILTIVAIGMGFSVSIMDYFQLNPNPSIILLPIIILTNLVDRFYSTTDEHGFIASIYRLTWTFVVTAICFFVFIIEPLQHLVLSYPEIHFFTLAFILLISAYKGKKLSSLPYGKWLKEPKRKGI
jgi:hypothetical protein